MHVAPQMPPQFPRSGAATAKMQNYVLKIQEESPVLKLFTKQNWFVFLDQNANRIDNKNTFKT